MKKRKIVGSAVVGNIVEYYDFGIYAVFAPIIGQVYFPTGDKFVTTLLTFLTFALGFLMRPLGGIIFGHIGDMFGRKTALTISIVGMSLSTFMIGSLPGYNHIGIMAPLLLVCIRLFQGICIGGEGAGSAIFILEHLEGYKPGLIGSIVMASNMVGTILATFTGLFIYHFFGQDGGFWRLGFILGGFMGVVGLYMRYHVSETPVFQNLQVHNEGKKTRKMPLLIVLQQQWKRVLIVAFLGGITSAVAYMIRGYLNVFFLQVMGYDHDTSLYFMSFALFNLIVMLPIFGLMADKVGYRKFLYITCSVIIILAMPVFQMIANPDKNIFIVLLGLVFLGGLAAAICAPAYPYAISAFAPGLRYSGIAFSWNAGIALFGGTTPAISTFLVKSFGKLAPAYYLIAMATIFIIVSFLTRREQFK